MSVDKAIALAAAAHAGQIDKAGRPYILHVLRVMMACEGRGEETLCAAVLHDVVEDTGVELAFIRHRFGHVVADAVDALSRRDGENYGDFIDRCAANPIAVIVKLADLADNMDVSRLSTFTRADHARLSKYRLARDKLLAVLTKRPE